MAARKIICSISSKTLNIYLGLIVSDKFTVEILQSHFSSLLKGYHPELYFIEFQLNFLIALLIAFAYALIENTIKAIYAKSKKKFSIH